MPNSSRCRVNNSYVVIHPWNAWCHSTLHYWSKEMVWMVHGFHQRTPMDHLRIHNQTIRLHIRSFSLRNSQHHTRNTMVPTKQTPKTHTTKQTPPLHRLRTKPHQTLIHQQLNPTTYTTHTHQTHTKNASPHAIRVAGKCLSFSGCRVINHRLISFNHGSTNETYERQS